MSDTVLYVEDHEDNVRLMERILKLRPHIHLVVAPNGAEGVRAAQRSRPRVVLLDRRLPDMPGTDVLRRLKADGPTAAIPVVVLSGDSAADAAREVLDLGAASFLAKPFDIGELLQLIDHYCPPGPPDER
jgi:CheY-like chemotaxis protein